MTAMILLQIAAKTTLVLLAGWGLTRALSRASAAARHLVWVLTLGAALAVPGMHLAGPAWTLAVLPQAEGAPDHTPASAPAADLDARTTSPASIFVEDVAPLGEPVELEATVVPATVPGTPDWGAVIVGVWLVGAVLMLLRLAAGLAWAGLTVRRARDLPHTGWLDSLDEAAASLSLSRPVALRVSPRAAVPMATGLWRAVVLLPVAAIDWPEERRRVVLQHELAHVKRRDCLVQVLAQCVCAVHWFNPLAHLAVSSLRAEQERACDDLVLQVGTDARCYADHLFEIARSFRAASFPSWVAMSMARPSQLEGRMLAILDSARARCAPSRPLCAGLIAATCLVAVPFGALRLSAVGTPAPGIVEASSTFRLAAATPAAARPQASDGFVVDTSRGPRQVDVVHGNLEAVQLLGMTPALDVGDAIRANLFIERDAVHVLDAADVTLPGGTLTLRRLAQAPTPAQTPAGVSDDTRRRVADALMSALNDDNPQVRQEALSSLASMRDERAVPGLVRALGDAQVDVRMRAIGALSQFTSAAAADGMVSALKDSNAAVRRQAARGLVALIGRGELRDPKYVTEVSQLLKDDDAGVRGQAARLLGRLGNADAVPSLTALLRDPSSNVREQAASSLGDLADPRAIDALTAALKDTEPSVREQVARALGQIARGQRRGARPAPGVRVPAPFPPFPPQAFIDGDRLREITDRAREAADRAREVAERDVEQRMRDFDLRFDGFDVPFLAPPAAPPTPPAPR